MNLLHPSTKQDPIMRSMGDHVGCFMVMFTLALASMPGAVAQTNCQQTKAGHGGVVLRMGGLQDLRSDSIDLIHTRIDLDVTDEANQSITAACTITLTPLVPNITTLRVDLIQLTVDSVVLGAAPLPFSHTGGVVQIDLGGPISPGDTLSPTIHYHGQTATDPSDFGGFYFEGQYIYDLGVAFESQPHSYGRSWFPCFDNFVERTSFEFHVKSRNGKRAWCNGEFLGETQLGGDTLLRSWYLTETIPSYLASASVAPYAVARDTFPSIGGGNIPVDLVALPGDTADMRASFIHLQDAFNTFETCFGAYSWNRVGYCLAPRGAMEHSTSITYPASIANGSLQYEATMAHELAHQWFGDLITCDRAEEMYINEGFAEYLSYLFIEAVDGTEAYKSTIRDNHFDMLKQCHWTDGGTYFALAEVPQDWTYGAHSYNKGADVLHSLRSYLGNADFCTGLTAFLNDHAYQAVNTTMLRDHLSATTGFDLTDFFEDWILQPGWTAFEVDSFTVEPPIGGSHPTTLFIEQKTRNADHFYHHVPVTVTCVDANGSLWEDPQKLDLDGQFSVATTTPPFIPAQIWLNADERLSLAVTGSTDSIADLGPETIQQANLIFTVNALPTPFLLRSEQYWVAADEETDQQFAYRVSPDRWWRLHGEFPAGTDMKVRITYDGRPNTSGGIDIGLMEDAGGVMFNEDSLVLLYRPNAHFPWTEVTNAQVNILGNAMDKFGRIEAEGISAGDLTLGWRISATGIDDGDELDEIRIFPDPASGWIVVEGLRTDDIGGTLVFRDITGRSMFEVPVTQERMHVPLHERANGQVLVSLRKAGSTEAPLGRVTVIR